VVRCALVGDGGTIGDSTCFGHHHAHHQENRTKPTNRLRCTSLAVLQQTRGEDVVRCALVGDGETIGDSTCFGHHYAHHQENKTKPTNRLRCTALAVLQQTRGEEVVQCALVGDVFTICYHMMSPRALILDKYLRP
jgi:hypothetical protein